jgi:hypothetical protein
VVELDIVYDMLDHRPKSDTAVRLRARQTAAILADHFCRSGVELVVVEGSFCDVDERAAFLKTLTTPITPHIVTLCVSVEQALHRVETDPTPGHQTRGVVARSGLPGQEPHGFCRAIRRGFRQRSRHRYGNDQHGRTREVAADTVRYGLIVN